MTKFTWVSLRSGAVIGVGGLLALICGFAIVVHPWMGLALGLAIPGLLILVSKAPARLAAVSIGALLVFQSTSNIGKYGYLALAILCCALSGIRLMRQPTSVMSAFKPMVWSGLLLLVILLLSGLVSRSSGVSAGDWARDVLSYVLLVTLPVVGLDAAQEIAPNRLDVAIAIFGVVAAIGFCLDWLERRGVSSLGVGRLILGTGMLCSLGFVHALVKGVIGRRHSWIWLSVSIFIATALLVTGTRTSLVFSLGILGLVGSRRNARASFLKLLSMIAPVVGVTVILVPIAASYVLTDPDFLKERMQAAILVFQDGDDQSFQIRTNSYALARERFSDSIWLGGGPGHAYPNGLFTLDTPWMLPAKFGVIGTAALLLYLGCIVISVRSCRNLSGPLPAYALARGWSAILVGATPFGPWVEDKGFGVALSLLLAAIVAATREALVADATPADQGASADRGVANRVAILGSSNFSGVGAFGGTG